MTRSRWLGTSPSDGLRVLVPRLHPGQRQVLAEARRHNWLAAGRRWRKTTLVMRLAVLAALRGQTVVWGAPTYDQVMVGWEETRRAASGVLRFNVSRGTARAPGNGRIVYRSLDDPDNARGHTADGVVVDEAADVRAEAWYEVLRPMLMDTGGWSWVVGTPKGYTWWHDEWQAALQAEDSRAWQAPTVGAEILNGELTRVPHPLENPNVPFAEIVRLWETMTERAFRQEILAQWVSGSGTVFSRLQDAVWTLGESGELLPWCGETPPAPGRVYAAGVDLARVRDWSVVTVLDITEVPYRQVLLRCWRNVPWEVQVERVAQAVGPYACRLVLVDRTGIGDMPFWTMVQRYPDIAWQGVTLSVANKAAMVQNLALMFEKATLKLLPDRDQLGELEIFEARERESGVVSYAAPAGRNDDRVMALVLAADGGARQAFDIV